MLPFISFLFNASLAATIICCITIAIHKTQLTLVHSQILQKSKEAHPEVMTLEDPTAYQVVVRLGKMAEEGAELLVLVLEDEVLT